MNANRIALRPLTVGPCSASPVHRWFGASASNRPNACGGCPVGRVVSSRRTKWRCRVRSSGAQPAVGAQDRRDLHRGPFRHLLLQRDRQVEHLGRGARRHPARVGHQSVEPAAAPVPDPPVDRGPRRPAPAARTGPHAHARRGHGPAGPAAWWSASGRRPRGSASTGTARPRGPVRPGPALACHGRRPWAPPRARCGERTRVARLVDQPAAPKGRLVLIHSAGPAGASSRPPVTAEASCHADTAPITPSRRRAAAAHAPITSTASANTDPAGSQRRGEAVQLDQQPGAQRPHRLGVPGKGAQPAAHRRRRPSQPRRNRPMPRPRALARNAAPITSTPSARRTRHETANSTCVTRHATHLARRGRSRPTPRTVRAPRVTPPGKHTPAWAHQLTGAQPPFDLGRVAPYHDHGCLPQHQGTALPSGQGAGRAVARPERDQVVVAHHPQTTHQRPL